MTENPIKSTGSSNPVLKKDKRRDIAMTTNPINKFMQSMTNQMTSAKAKAKVKAQAILNNDDSSTVDSRERSSTDLVIAAETDDKWVKYDDPKTGLPYWHNEKTDETTWNDPKTKSHNRIASQWA
eukprot:g2783.t1